METIIPGTIYRHYKGGRYIVLHIARDSTNNRDGNKGVVYFSLAKRTVNYRDVSEFTEEIMWPDGVTRPRFIPEEPDASAS